MDDCSKRQKCSKLGITVQEEKRIRLESLWKLYNQMDPKFQMM
jgi:hypothetical protein